MAFNRNRSFNNRGEFSGRRNFDKPQMHQTVCDKCRKDCEVPFKPTSGKPVYCNDCFDRPTSGRNDGRNFDRPNFAEKRMFDAVCDECKNNCQVPFQPSGDKPIYCSSCFGNKGGRSENRNVQTSNPNYEEQFALLNSKIDQVLSILTPIAVELEAEPILEEPKASKKSSSKKK